MFQLAVGWEYVKKALRSRKIDPAGEKNPGKNAKPEDQTEI